MMNQKSKKRNDLYIALDDLLGENASDSALQAVLVQFERDDFLKAPILFDLAAEKRINVLKDLYHRCIPFSYMDESGANMLHVASGANGNLGIVTFLFENKILTDINAQTDENETPFILAVMYGHKDIVAYFLKHSKPDLTIKTTAGETAISLAEKGQDLDLMRLLKECRGK